MTNHHNDLISVNAIPGVILVFDFSALVIGKTQEWQHYTNTGLCYLPGCVYQELKLLTINKNQAAPTKLAQEFMLFWSTSGWKLTNTLADHPLLQPALANQSKEARLIVAVAQSAYSLSQKHQNKLIILITNHQLLLERIEALNVTNLSGINLTALREWCRTKFRPLLITQKLQNMMQLSTSLTISSTLSSQIVQKGNIQKNPKTVWQTTQLQGTKPRKTPLKKPVSSLSSKSPVTSGQPSLLALLISGILAFMGLTIITGFTWRSLDLRTFNQVWDHLGLPDLPAELF